jgi:hypothetical protein
MSDEMIDLAAGDVRLRRRLEAYAEHRLSPDLTGTSRMRARVLAHAHRHADRARADAALTIVSATAAVQTVERGRSSGRGFAISLVAAAVLVGAMVGGAAASSGPGGALYDARLWAEAVTLPSEPSARAVAELARLAERLREAEAAAGSGDTRAAAAALGAYERIMGEASAGIVGANDAVAAAAFEAGVGRNVAVLQALIGRVPAQAADAIGRALERAIARSNGALHSVQTVGRPTTDGGTVGGANGNGGNGAGNRAGSGSAGAGNGNSGSGAGTGNGQQATPKPTKTPSPEPVATPKPTRTERPEPTPKSAKTPKPTTRAPAGQPSNDPPG